MAKDRYHTLGAKLGPRLAKMFADAHVAAERKLLHEKHRLAMHVFEDASNMIGGEFHATSGDLLKEMREHPETAPHAARLLKLAGDGKGQGGAISAAWMLGGGAVSSFSTILSNALYPAVASIVSADPHIPPGISELAVLTARGLLDYGKAQNAAEGQGMGGGWFESLVEASRSWPDVPVVLELLRRGEIDGGEASRLLERIGIPSQVFGPMLKLQRQLLSPADAALGTLRNTISDGRAREIYQAAGLTEKDFQVLVDNTGEPPPLEELLMLWRRGKINTEKLNRGIRQSRVRDEWVPIVHELKIQPPTQDEALAALLEGQIPREEAHKRFVEAGGDPTWFQAAFDSRGSAPTPVEAGEMANRGIIPWDGKGPDATSFEQAFLEGPWRNKWSHAMRRLAEYYPPPRTITTLVRDAAISKKEAYKLFREQGLKPELAQAYIESATTDKTLQQKNLAVGQISQLYTDQAIDREEARKMWGDLGYDKHETHLLSVLADLARTQRYMETAISTVHSRYTAHVISHQEAVADLNELGVPHGQRDSLLRMWDLERKAKAKLLTEAQVVKAFKKEVISRHSAQARLEKMGYPAEDADILLQIA